MDCTPSSLMQDAKCFQCLGPLESAAIQTYLLCQIAEMSCDPASLMEDAKCFTCLDMKQLQAIAVYLLCQILAGGGGGGGATQVLCGNSDPDDVTDAPVGTTCAFYYRPDNGAVWFWKNATSKYIPLIAA